MKLILVLLFLVPLSTFSQDCKLKRTKDPYTKETRISTGLIALSGTSLAIQADNKEIDFFFSMDKREACFNDGSTAIINYDSTRLKGTFRNGGATNCEGFFHIIFRNSPATNSLLQRLITQRIAKIEFTGTDKKKATIELSREEAEKVKSMAECLVTEAKTLIK